MAFFTARKNTEGRKTKIVRDVTFASGVPIRAVPSVMAKGAETLIAIRNLQRRSKPAEKNTVNGFPHFGKNSEASPGPSEKLPLGKRIYDSGH
jgi:hypothetical protein